MAPFASSPDKTLDASRTAALINALASIPRTRVVLVGAPADRTRAGEIVRRTPAPVTDLVGQTDLPALCDVLRRCQIVISVDSGPMHLAAALGVAAFLLSRGEDFSILFPTRYGTFHLHISVLLIAISIIAVFAIKRLDLGKELRKEKLMTLKYPLTTVKRTILTNSL